VFVALGAPPTRFALPCSATYCLAWRHSIAEVISLPFGQKPDWKMS
jgi:hypothetical protein